MEPLFFASPGEFRAWLASNHASVRELWVGFRRVATGEPSMTWPQAVDEALCFGWIDGVRKSLDAARYVIRFTPRSPRSRWSQVNLRRARELTAAGRMEPAGAQVFENATAAQPAYYSYEPSKELVFSEDQTRAFKRDEDAWTYFTAQAPWYRRAATHWVVTAKKPETQVRRLAELIACSRAGKPVKPLQRK